MSSKAGMDVLGSEKISCTYWGSNSGSSSKEASHYDDCAIMVSPLNNMLYKY